MNCSGRSFLLRVACLTSVGALLAAGCGGTATPKKNDGGDGGPGDALAAAFKLTPTSNDFGSVEIGKSSAPFVFMLSNAGGATSGAPMISVSGGDFTQTSMCGALNANATCMISVVFKPSSAGSKTGTLTVNAMAGGAVTASLSGQGAMPGLNITPSTHDYGPVAVGAMSDAFTLTVSNTGAVAVGGLAVNLNGMDYVATDNKCTGMTTLAPGASCAVSVAFKPGSAGIKNGSLIASGGGQTVTASLSGTGQSPAMLIINPSSAMLVGQTTKVGAPVTFNVANAGDISTAAVAAALGGTDAASFTITANTCLAPLAKGASCQVSVATAASATAGTKNATLTVSSATGGMAVATLTASVTTIGTLTITPNSADFMTVNVGATSAAIAFEVKNTGGSPTTPLTVSASTGEFIITANTCGAALAGGATCAVSVSFKPVSQGVKSAILTVQGSAGETVQASLVGSGVGLSLTINPMTPNFGTVVTGLSSVATTLTVTNTGGNASGALTTALGGTNASQWEISGNNCNGSLAPAATCMVTLLFKPTTVGDKTATLTVTGAAGATVSATLSGSGLAPGGITLTPANPFPVAPGTVVGTTSAPVTITVLNGAGNAPTGKLTFTLTNVAASEYTVGSNNCPEVGLSGGNSCTITVTFSPTAAGARLASLQVLGAASGSPSGSVQLNGTGKLALEVLDSAAPNLASFDFGSTSVGVPTAAHTFDIFVRSPFANVTAAVGTHFTNTAVVCAGNQPSTVVAANSATWVQCTVTARFAPADRTPPAKTGTLTVTGTGGTTATAALSGTAIGPLVVTPTIGEFGNVVVNTPSAAMAFVVTNNHPTLALNPITLTLGGADMGQFAITTNTCTGGAAAAGGTCGFSITLTATTAGPKAATVKVDATVFGSATVETQTINLTGTAGVGMPITALPAALTFPATVLFANSAVQTITVANPAGAATVAAIVVGGAPGEFNVVTNNCTGALIGGANCTVTVRFSPVGTFIGARTGTITFTGGGNTATVTLAGTTAAPLTISPTSFGFGTAAIADANAATHDFVVTNNSAGAATAITTTRVAGSGVNPDIADFQIVTGCAATLAAGASCTVTVRYSPNALLAVTSTADLQVAATIGAQPFTATAALSGTRALEADLEFVNEAGLSPTQALGTVRLGTTVDYTATVQNVGEVASGALAAITLGGPDAVEFSIQGGTCTIATTLAPGATCTVIVRHTPAGLNANTGTLVVGPATTRGGSTGTLTLTATGVANASLYITPNPQDLGVGFFAAPAATPAAVTFTVHNNLGAATAAAVAVTASDAQFVKSADTCTAILADGATCTFNLQFTPANATPAVVRGTVSVTDTAVTATAGIFGRKQVDATFAHTPATVATGAYDFGSVVRDVQSGDVTFTVTNIGERTSGPISLGKGGTNPTEFSIQPSSTCLAMSLVQNTSCTVVVRFTPLGSVAAAAKDATVTITSVPGNTGTIYLKGTSVLTASVSAAVSGVGGSNYGDTPLGVDITRTVTLTNVASGQTTTVGASLSSTTNFQITGGTCITVSPILTGGSACTFTVLYDPTVVSASALTSILTVTSSVGTAPAAIVLQGTSSSAITSTPATETMITVAGNMESFTFANAAGAANTGQLTVSVTGTDAALFQVIGDTCTTMGSLAAAGSCVVTVRFVPGGAAAGAKTATLIVTGAVSGNNDSVALTATN